MTRSWTPAVVFVVLTMPAAAAAQQECAWCDGMSEAWCDTRDLDYPCYKWIYSEEGTRDRGQDWHYFFESYWGGNGDCDGHGQCGSGGGSLVWMERQRAIEETDVSSLRNALRDNPSAWFEFNHTRQAVQVLVACANAPTGGVFAHLPVSRETVEYWGYAASESDPVPTGIRNRTGRADRAVAR